MTDLDPIQSAWKAIKAAALFAFAHFVAPSIAAHAGIDATIATGIAASVGHAALNVVGQKTGYTWL